MRHIIFLCCECLFTWETACNECKEWLRIVKTNCLESSACNLEKLYFTSTLMWKYWNWNRKYWRVQINIYYFYELHSLCFCSLPSYAFSCSNLSIPYIYLHIRLLNFTYPYTQQHTPKCIFLPPHKSTYPNLPHLTATCIHLPPLAANFPDLHPLSSTEPHLHLITPTCIHLRTHASTYPHLLPTNRAL